MAGDTPKAEACTRVVSPSKVVQSLQLQISCRLWLCLAQAVHSLMALLLLSAGVRSPYCWSTSKQSVGQAAVKGCAVGHSQHVFAG